ncbi:Putative FAD/NAD(P)-binding domain, FAD/NAD(P)-binding domain superfamily [Septoria linicola]|uniref:FAD/NAD(P)-binding domain, FAD/NAD(P)-binding domain superfamily n=1 Tax=Septoria linicola TaxID=215465 RepID=A0A9Q9EIE2_9PEZI|nr:putative FAD/NAD(P)-binding domain, FAD/NAD(P)-binding domain superfamily [Septoria linicola]USW50942.1 Putative FAD/NAD(P)-binding domain, FAD/NAD(P)-binding domain superfamily [Septoria linicola]
MATHADTNQVRRDSAMSGPDDTYEAVVVGAGPAGITAVGNLLENRVDRILWVDESFNGGRVNQYYREVPSNTKVKLFVDFAQAVSPFRKIVSDLPSRDRWEEPNPSDGAAVKGSKDKLQDLRTLDQEKGCHLSHAADMCLMLTNGLKRTPGVVTQLGRVADATLDQSSQTWTVNLDTKTRSAQDITNVKTKRIVLCTGSTPLDPKLPYEPAGLQHINLDDALSPTNLSALLSPLGPTKVAVIGASHSAILVLWNLAHLAQTSKPDLQVKWFTRHPLRYAEFEDGFIARDNTGLKGAAATWAKENLEPDRLPSSPIIKVIEKISYQKGDEEKVYRQHIDDAQFVVQAIGYTRNQIPDLKLSTGEAVQQPTFDHDKGVFSYTTASGEKEQLPGVYGAGIAFPQRVVDKKYGHEEYNVGFFKFMKAVKGWVEGWKPVA